MLSRDCYFYFFFFNTVIGLQFFFQSSLDVDSLYVLHVLYALVETNILEHAAHCSQSDLCFGLIRRRLIMVQCATSDNRYKTVCILNILLLVQHPNKSCVHLHFTPDQSLNMSSELELHTLALSDAL